VDNRPGAASIIGSDLVSKSVPDGYMLLMGTISHTANAAVYKQLPIGGKPDDSGLETGSGRGIVSRAGQVPS